MSKDKMKEADRIIIDYILEASANLASINTPTTTTTTTIVNSIFS